MSRLDLLDRIRTAGVVGLGGGSLPTHLKLALPPGSTSPMLVANGVDSEPSMSADDALLRGKAAEILEGLRVCQALLKPVRTVIALGEHSEDIVPELEGILRQSGMKADVKVLPSRYPQGHEQLVLAALQGTAPGAVTPATVLNVATLFAIFEAVLLDKPLIERVLTVTGSAVARPRNLKARFGTGINDLLDECGGLTSPPGKLVMGGPMRGVSVDSLDVPVTKRTCGIVAFGAADARPGAELPVHPVRQLHRGLPVGSRADASLQADPRGRPRRGGRRGPFAVHGVRLLRVCLPFPDPPRRDPAPGQTLASLREQEDAPCVIARTPRLPQRCP